MEDLNYCVFVAIGEEYHSVLKFKTQCLPTSRQFIAENCRNTVFTLQTMCFGVDTVIKYCICVAFVSC